MHKIKKSLIVIPIIVFLLLPALLKSQNSPKDDFTLSAQGHVGYIMAHRDDMANLIKGHIYGGELNYIFRTNGCKTWHKYYKYPELGFCFLHL